MSYQLEKLEADTGRIVDNESQIDCRCWGVQRAQACEHNFMEETNIVHESWLECRDNQAAITISYDSSYARRAKHIVLFFLAIQDTVNRRVIVLTFCASNENAAEILTKALL